MQKIFILGDGGWGTTISILLFEKGYDVTLWSYDSSYAEVLDKQRENVKFLPGVKIPSGIKITSNIEELNNKDINFVIFAIPSIYFRKVIRKITHYSPEVIFISLTKGIEVETFKRMSEIVNDELGKVNLALLSGPSIAYEVVNKVPTSVVVASREKNITDRVQELFTTNYFRVYTSRDVVGVELGGAFKNIIAIAAGICDGLGLGNNSKAALLCRGLVEMVRLGKILGADSETFFGLSGLGDMITTSFSSQSRNRRVGEEIGRGKDLNEILKEMQMVAEGIYTVKAVYQFSKKHNVEMPITEKVYQVLYEGKVPKVAVGELMLREPKPEIIK